MSIFIYVAAYAALVIFLLAVIYRIVVYIKHPIHIRWELYPVAHEGQRASYGGSYMEEVDWWEKDRERSLLGELKVMLSEILLLKAVWEHNRSLWYRTYTFHLGLYFCAAGLGLLILSVVFNLAGIPVDSALSAFLAAATGLILPVGMVLGIIGAALLFFRRLIDDEMRNYSSFEHFFNLAIFIFTMGAALLSWRMADPSFHLARSFIANLIRFNFTHMDNPIFDIQVILVCLLIAYIPLTHMSHFFMKYFLYHDIRWGDEPNVDNLETDAKIGVVLNYPVTWSASHIAGHGKSTWAEVATFNPAAKPETKKE